MTKLDDFRRKLSKWDARKLLQEALTVDLAIVDMHLLDSGDREMLAKYRTGLSLLAAVSDQLDEYFKEDADAT